MLGTSRNSSSTRRHSLADALFTKTQQRVLGVLFGDRPDLYARELISTAGTGLELRSVNWPNWKKAASWSLAASATRSTIRRMRPRRFAELRSIILKTLGLAEPLRAALKPLSSAIRIAFVYGSIARSEDRAGSDVDLMIVSDAVTYGEVFGALERVAKSLGRPVNPTVYTKAEFAKRSRDGNAFVTRVLEQPKLWVIGSADDLPLAS